MRSMVYFVLVLVLTGLRSCNSQTENRPGHCAIEAEGTLEWRVINSEVVITGTIVQADSENSHGEEKDEFDVGHHIEKRPSNMPGHQSIAFVKLWRVLKGTIEHVTNYSDVREGVAERIHDPVIKLYGLWNDHICGSHLKFGSTRIFFLRKLLDARPDIFNRNHETSFEAHASTYLSQLTTSIPAVDDVLSLAPPIQKHKKKRRRGKRGKKRGRKRSQNSEGRRKSGRGKRKRARRKRKTTESMYQSLRNLRRPKRGVLTPSSLSMMQKLRVDDHGKHVLVVVSPPARITLENLNLIEAIVDLD